MDTTTKNLLLAPLNLLYKISPKTELKLLFRLKQGYKLNLKNPKTFNEKLQWIKLYDKNPLMPKCVDKYTVREYVESVGCGEILNKLLWQGFNPDDIPFDKLPNKFVIKVTHGSTFNIICTDKSKLDQEKTKAQLKKWLKAKFLPCYGEWFYGVEKPRIIVEKYLEDKAHKVDLFDYKVFCFNGKPKVIGVYSDRQANEKPHQELYDLNWNLIKEHTNSYSLPEKLTVKPKCLKQLLEYSKKLSKDFKHVRVDFFIENEKIYFGELTFTSSAGFGKFSSESFAKQMGSWLKLPLPKRNSGHEE